jgi:ATP-dependent DNA helicase PIF1
VKYLYKYVTKGNDRVTFSIDGVQTENIARNEIKEYKDGRYLSPPEAAARLFGFKMNDHHPSVCRLHLHLLNEQNVIFRGHDRDNIQAAIDASEYTSLTAFFETVVHEITTPPVNNLLGGIPETTWAKSLLYHHMPRYYTYTSKSRYWKRRHSSTDQGQVGRCYIVSPIESEKFHLRLLLNRVLGPTSFESLRTFNGIVHTTFKDACFARGMLINDNEWDAVMEEASLFQSANLLRDLFINLLLINDPHAPIDLWNKFKTAMSEDYAWDRAHRNSTPMIVTDEDINCALICLRDKLLSQGHTLHKHGLPEPIAPALPRNYVREIAEQTLSGTQIQSLQESLQIRIPSLNVNQRRLFDVITTTFANGQRHLYFIDAPGGTGKTYLFNIIADYIRSHGNLQQPYYYYHAITMNEIGSICLCIAGSGIAAILLHGGSTIHSALKLPIKITAQTMSSATSQSGLGKLMAVVDAIIWDEMCMAHKDLLHAVDRTFREMKRCPHTPFGGVMIIGAGDWRQTLPVIPGASRAVVCRNTIKHSHLWPTFKQHALHENQRVIQRERIAQAAGHVDNRFRDFIEWQLKIGNGLSETFPNVHTDAIEIPAQFTIPGTSHITSNSDCKHICPHFITAGNSFHDLIHWCYGDICARHQLPTSLTPQQLLIHHGNIHKFMSSRAILTPKNVDVDQINTFAIDLLPGNFLDYYSADTVGENDDPTMFPIEYLNTIHLSSFPIFHLRLKVGAPITLIRNINKSQGLVNGTRFIVTALGTNIITARIMGGPFNETQVIIPRITLSTAADKYPFELRRRQFPVRLCYCTTINKSQGQTYQRVALYLPSPVFSHGQLYVGISRVGSPEDLGIMITPTHIQGNFEAYPDRLLTSNVVYRECL